MRAFIFLLVAALASTPLVSEAAGKDSIVVMQRVDTRYDLPGVLTSALNQALPAETTIKKGDTFSGVLSRLYTVGEDSVSPAVQPITDWIQRENALSPGQLLIAGQNLVVPDIPKLGKTQPGPNPANAVPRLSVDLRSLNNLQGLLKLDADQHIEDALRPAARLMVNIRELTADQAKDALARDPQLLLISAPLTVKLVQAQAAATLTTMGPGDAALIQFTAARPQLQHPVLLIFDETWPSLDEEERSRAYLLSALKQLRAHFLVPPMTPFNAKCAPGVAAGTWQGVGDSHASEVATALKPFLAAAGPSSPVTVVYLPLLAEGSCSSEMIGQLAEFHMISEHMADQFGKAHVPSSTAARYHALAKEIAGQLDSAAVNGTANTNVEAIQGVFEFARRQGEVLNAPIFISMSWDFPLDRYQPEVPPEFGGLFVVAAGNDGDLNGAVLPPISTTKMQFGARSMHPGDMLAVMNVGADGHLTCHSSLVDPAGSAFATSYFGDLDANDCGTSYSTPRVAFLLALREAKRAPLPDLTNLSTQIRADLAAGTNGSPVQPGVYRLDVAKLLAAAP